MLVLSGKHKKLKMASDQVGKVGMGGVGTRSRRDLAAASRRAGNKEVSSQGNGSGTSGCWYEADVPRSVDCLLVVGTRAL